MFVMLDMLISRDFFCASTKQLCIFLSILVCERYCVVQKLRFDESDMRYMRRKLRINNARECP